MKTYFLIGGLWQYLHMSLGLLIFLVVGCLVCDAIDKWSSGRIVEYDV